MKPASARRTRSPAAGRGGAPAHRRRRTSAPRRPTSSAPSARSEGKGAALILPWCNTEAMSLHLAEIATESRPASTPCCWSIRPGGICPTLRRAATTSRSCRCPEMSRAQPGGERLAVHARQLVSNRVFTSYDDLVDHCCDAWNNLVDQPWRIMSIWMTPMGAWVLINGTWYTPCPDNLRNSLGVFPPPRPARGTGQVCLRVLRPAKSCAQTGRCAETGRGMSAPYDIRPPTATNDRKTEAAGRRCLIARSAIVLEKKIP